MLDVLNLFGEYTLYIYGAIAVLLFYKKDGVPLWKYLLDKTDEKKEKVEGETLRAEVTDVPQVEPVERVEMPKVAEGVKAVGITLVNQDLDKLSIENK